MKTALTRMRLPLGVSLAILLLASGWARANGPLPDCYVLSAGVDNYPNANKLNGCLNDARNTTAAFQGQQGFLFGQVHAQTLLDGNATSGNISQRFHAFTNQGKAGDYFVLFLSGHGGRTNNDQTWYFLPYNYQPQNRAATTLSDRQLLDAADGIVKQGKKVVIVIDACFSGQLGHTAQPYLARYRNPQGGGLVLMMSSSASQTSAALGQYSAFAKAFVDSMKNGDLNHDKAITVGEIRQYSYKHTYELLRQRNMNDKQDSQVAWSPSISSNMPLAMLKRSTSGPVVTNPGTTVSLPTQWVGTENLAGFGKLAFHLHNGGKVTMTDTAGSSEGTWHRAGQQITLRFSNGRVVYSGMLNGSNLSGTAHNDRTSWSFNVHTPASFASRN